MLDSGLLGGAHRRLALRDLIGALFPKIRDGEDSVGALESGSECLGPVQIGGSDFVGDPCVLTRVSRQRAGPKLAASPKGADNSTALVAGGADDCDQWCGVGWHVLISLEDRSTSAGGRVVGFGANRLWT